MLYTHICMHSLYDIFAGIWFILQRLRVKTNWIEPWNKRMVAIELEGIRWKRLWIRVIRSYILAWWFLCASVVKGIIQITFDRFRKLSKTWFVISMKNNYAVCIKFKFRSLQTSDRHKRVRIRKRIRFAIQLHLPILQNIHRVTNGK